MSDTNNNNTATTTTNDNDIITLVVRLSNGMKFDITLLDNQTVHNTTILMIKELISTISNEYIQNVPVSLQRIIYKGRILDNTKTLNDYTIENHHTIFFVKSVPKTTTPAPTATSASTSTPPMAARPASNMTGMNPSVGGAPPVSPFGGFDPSMMQGMMNANNGMGGMGGMDGLGGMGSGNVDPATIMNNPVMRNMIQNNPDFLRNMMRSQMDNNPTFQRMMEQNPSIRHMLDDPAQFQEMMNMISNPNAMQQMMRSQDLALSQIENMPGGFAALTNMYETIQRPLEEESYSNSSTGTATNNTNRNSQATNDGATGAAMPNPWGSPTPTPPSVPSLSMPNSSNNASAAANPFMMNPNDPNMMNMMTNANNPWTGAGGAPLGAGAGTGQQPSFEQRQAAFQMLQNNPSMTNMMNQTVRTNPGMIRQMMMQQVGSNDPMASMMFQNMSDEQLIHMFTNMMNPDNMNRLLQMEQQMQGLNVQQQQQPNPWMMMSNNNNPNAAFANNNNNNSMNNPSLDFSNLFRGGGGGMMPPAVGGNMTTSPWGNSNNMAANIAPTPPPGELYRIQLRSLYDMGFDDEIRNVAALQMTNGNLNSAVDMLISGTVPIHAIQNATASLAVTSSTSSIDNNNITTTTTTENQDVTSSSLSSTADVTPKSDNDTDDKKMDEPKPE